MRRAAQTRWSSVRTCVPRTAGAARIVASGWPGTRLQPTRGGARAPGVDDDCVDGPAAEHVEDAAGGELHVDDGSGKPVELHEGRGEPGRTEIQHVDAARRPEYARQVGP